MSPANDQDDAWYPTRRTELRIEDKMAKDKKDKKRPYAELFLDRDGFRYRICEASGVVMVTSHQHYKSISEAADGLFALIAALSRFKKWYDKGDDSWLRDLTDGDEEHSVAKPLRGPAESFPESIIRRHDAAID